MSIGKFFKRKINNLRLSLGEFELIAERHPAECGPASLAMILRYLGEKISLDEIVRDISLDYSTGASLLTLSDYAETKGYTTESIRIDFENLLGSNIEPYIIFWEGNRFVVVYSMTEHIIKVANSEQGFQEYNVTDFCDGWYCDRENPSSGVVLWIKK